ncbi:metallophosphoesterase [Aquabacterium sp.]|uniref:metallophosphoesterase n=1 Tax=Aquabacterium sp. TaxID=1872578 RepID=UPI002C5A457D|nr:metallophosphoesterase [Aquabacterium sp.]HSW07581.1 metallophosphoesterase [Aquabacterium sp.]
MRLQLLSDLHLETETFDPRPAPGAEVLVLAGDIDARWDGLSKFANWPVPVLMVAGNHEFDRRELNTAWPALRSRCEALGLRLLECESVVLTSKQGLRVRFVGTIRWSDFDLFGPQRQAHAMRAGAYFLKLMAATRGGEPLDVSALREESLACRQWLADELTQAATGRWDATVVITHFAPSLRSADPRFGSQSGTASFCNADDALIPLADLWLHGHLHCRQDYEVSRPGRAPARVVCQAAGLARKGERRGLDPLKLIEVQAAA